jgi:hypothetical protein
MLAVFFGQRTTGASNTCEPRTHLEAVILEAGVHLDNFFLGVSVTHHARKGREVGRRGIGLRREGRMAVELWAAACGEKASPTLEKRARWRHAQPSWVLRTRAAFIGGSVARKVERLLLVPASALAA